MAQTQTESLSIHLQGIGLHIAKLASEIAKGDVLVWNYGQTSQVASVRPVSSCFLEVTVISKDGALRPLPSAR
jgi:hypothetical protein